MVRFRVLKDCLGRGCRKIQRTEVQGKQIRQKAPLYGDEKEPWFERDPGC